MWVGAGGCPLRGVTVAESRKMRRRQTEQQDMQRAWGWSQQRFT